MIKPAVFANWHLSKLGSNPLTETGKEGCYNYILKGWLPGP